jgi:protein-disulfide isomerase
MKKSILLCAIALLPLLSAQTQAVKTAPVVTPASDGISKELGEAILKELHQIRTLLEKQQPAPQAAAPLETAKISSAGFSIGQDNAPLVLVEFADYQCPFCRQFQSSVYERLKKNYIDSGKLRFVSRDLPLDIHSNAFAAANASRCAGDQNKFWQMRETLISHASKLEPEAVNGYAQTLGLDMVQFRSCVASGKYLPSIRADIDEANAAGIMGTPTFILGEASPTGIIEGVKLIGAQPYEVFEKVLAEQLAKSATTHTAPLR